MSEPTPTHLPVAGSTRASLLPAGAAVVGNADPAASVEVTVVLRRAHDDPHAFRAHPADIAAVEAFAAEHELTVASVHAPSRTVALIGTAAQMAAAFLVELSHVEHDGRVYRGRVGDIYVPAALAPVVVAVLGLDERAQARAPHRVAAANQNGYPPQQVSAFYGFPTSANGAGQTVAIIELGGGYRASDLSTYFAGEGLKTPSVTAVSVGGAKNAPGRSDADVEVALDIEVVGAVAQGAAQAVYFAANTDQGFYNGIAAAVHDTVRNPKVITISWGGPENSWTAQAMDSFDALFADAAALGITVLAASGDNGSTDGSQDNSQQVDFPASSPHVVACGGTTLTSNSEVVWNETQSDEGATGGGVSQHFGLPTYQAGANVPLNPAGKPGRGVPDVAGNADPVTGYQVYVGGQAGVVGGTSAVAPLWAGLIAIANQINGKPAGDVHAALYANPAALTDITSGNNGVYQSAAGWDPCTGLGSPKGAPVVAALAGTATGTGGGTTPPPPVTTPTDGTAAALLTQVGSALGQVATNATSLQGQIAAWLTANPTSAASSSLASLPAADRRLIIEALGGHLD